MRIEQGIFIFVCVYTVHTSNEDFVVIYIYDSNNIVTNKMEMDEY